MASMRDIKRRKTSIQSTQQITKAMKLVSTVKLQRTKAHAESAKPYFDSMYNTVCSVLSRTGEVQHPYLQGGGSGKKAVVVITSNRGLAGGYNSNVVKMIERGELKKEDLRIYAIGKKGRETLARHGYEVAESDLDEVMENPTYADAMRISQMLLKDFENGEISEIHLAYTFYKNTVSHVPTLLQLLPVSIDKDDVKEESEASSKALMSFEPNEEEALNLIVPKYVTSLIYSALIEAVASENGARMQAMDSATDNAEKMISGLELQYNRARQGSITQELTEIIAGAEAIS